MLLLSLKSLYEESQLSRYVCMYECMFVYIHFSVEKRKDIFSLEEQIH